MAGSYNHAVTKKGKLLNPENMRGMLDSFGDCYEALEEMYGMIWDLADDMASARGITPEQAVEEARKNYRRGLDLSPGIQKPNN